VAEMIYIALDNSVRNACREDYFLRDNSFLDDFVYSFLAPIFWINSIIKPSKKKYHRFNSLN
jgi:hypothetical protein